MSPEANKGAKGHKKGERGKLGSEITKKLSMISATYSYKHSMLRRNTAQRASKLWEKDNFENYNIFGSKTIVAGPGRITRIFRAREEGWEKDPFDSAGY